MKNFLKGNQWSQSRKSKLIVAWIGLTLRMIVGVLLIGGTLVFFREMTKNAATMYSYVLCALIPIFAVIIVVGDILIRYKLDIRPLKKTAEKKKNPLEFK